MDKADSLDCVPLPFVELEIAPKLVYLAVAARETTIPENDEQPQTKQASLGDGLGIMPTPGN